MGHNTHSAVKSVLHTFTCVAQMKANPTILHAAVDFRLVPKCLPVSQALAIPFCSTIHAAPLNEMRPDRMNGTNQAVTRTDRVQDALNSRR